MSPVDEIIEFLFETVKMQYDYDKTYFIKLLHTIHMKLYPLRYM